MTSGDGQHLDKKLQKQAKGSLSMSSPVFLDPKPGERCCHLIAPISAPFSTVHTAAPVKTCLEERRL